MERRVLVCGGRDYSDEARVFSELDAEHANAPITLLIHGGATGADTLAGKWAAARKIAVRPFPANWFKHGQSAGPIRNRDMLTQGKPHMVIAFPGGRGTADMINAARAASVPVVKVRP